MPALEHLRDERVVRLAGDVLGLSCTQTQTQNANATANTMQTQRTRNSTLSGKRNANAATVAQTHLKRKPERNQTQQITNASAANAAIARG